MIRLFFAFVLLFAGCSKNEHTLKVAATSVPHAEMLNAIKQDLADQGIQLQIVVVEDFQLPNRALADKEIDANFFQHTPFLLAQVKSFHYPITTLAKVHIEPMGIYSKKIKKLADLPEKGIVSVPNDPTNEARALDLLDHQRVISLDIPHNLNATVLNIDENPKHLKVTEIDAAMLPRTLPDVDAAVINTNFAMQAGLSPLKDALAIEDSSSPYANVIAIREGEDTRPELIALKKAMTSDRMRTFIMEKYQGAIIPAF